MVIRRIVVGIFFCSLVAPDKHICTKSVNSFHVNSIQTKSFHCIWLPLDIFACKQDSHLTQNLFSSQTLECCEKPHVTVTLRWDCVANANCSGSATGLVRSFKHVHHQKKVMFASSVLWEHCSVKLCPLLLVWYTDNSKKCRNIAPVNTVSQLSYLHHISKLHDHYVTYKSSESLAGWGKNGFTMLPLSLGSLPSPCSPGALCSVILCDSGTIPGVCRVPITMCTAFTHTFQGLLTYLLMELSASWEAANCAVQGLHYTIILNSKFTIHRIWITTLN
jgi:hypothetical protein